nr:MAG TPA: hypothetical protein [Caudoviricetes sp.]
MQQLRRFRLMPLFRSSQLASQMRFQQCCLLLPQ